MMNSKRPRVIRALVATTCCVCPAVFAAENPLGFYIGAGVGQATVRENPEMSNTSYAFDQSDAGWDLFAGLRPESVIGAEIAYVNFGHPSAGTHIPTVGPYTEINTDAKVSAVAAYAVGYLPLPVSWLDLYGKAGLARLQTEYRYSDFGTVCVPGYACPAIAFGGTLNNERTKEDFAYGGGAQLKFAAWSVRLEYQRVSASGGDPDLLSLAIAWTF
jgi:opacity protein-like surface antigen